jgi:hypothetical protein
MRWLLLPLLILAVAASMAAVVWLRPGRARRVTTGVVSHTPIIGRPRVRGGMPADSFFASGTQEQRTVIAPAERLVVVRLGHSQDWETFDIRGLIRLVAEVNAALSGAGP